MAIQLASNLIPRNGNTWPIAEDIHIKGGYRTVANLQRVTQLILWPSSLGCWYFVLLRANTSV